MASRARYDISPHLDSTPLIPESPTRSSSPECPFLQFIAGVGRKIATMGGADTTSQVLDILGDLAFLAASVEGMVLGVAVALLLFLVGYPLLWLVFGALGLPQSVGVDHLERAFTRPQNYAALVPAVDYHPPRNAGRALEAFIERAPSLVMRYRPTGAIAFGVTEKVPSS